MDLKSAFQILHTNFGTHKAVAHSLGLSWVHYANIRNGRVNIPKRTADLILLKAREVSEPSPAPAPEREEA